MKRLTLPFLFLFSFFIGSAQNANYDLSKYKLADFKFRQLNTSFSFDGNLNNQYDAFNQFDKNSLYMLNSQVNLDYFGQKKIVFETQNPQKHLKSFVFRTTSRSERV